MMKVVSIFSKVYPSSWLGWSRCGVRDEFRERLQRLQRLPGFQASLQTLHDSRLHDARLHNSRAAVVQRSNLIIRAGPAV